MADGSPKVSAFTEKAKEFLDAHTLVVDASNALADWIRSQIPLVRRHSQAIADLTEQVIDKAAFEAVGKIQRSRREVIWRTPNFQKEDQGPRLHRSGLQICYMDFPLPSGIKLGDANGPMILAAAANYERVAEDASQKAAWLSMVAEAVGDRTVRDVLSEGDLASMRAKV